SRRRSVSVFRSERRRLRDCFRFWRFLSKSITRAEKQESGNYRTKFDKAAHSISHPRSLPSGCHLLPNLLPTTIIVNIQDHPDSSTSNGRLNFSVALRIPKFPLFRDFQAILS